MFMKYILAFLLFSTFAFARNKIVYGVDNRQNYEEVEQRFQLLADATATMVRSYDLKEYSDGFKFNRNLLGKHFFGDQFEHGKLCEEEKFRDEALLGNCSGFLVRDDILITAGHCVSHKDDCKSNKWVFNFNKEESTKGILSKNNVFECSEILSFGTGDKDYGVIKLDRPVFGRTPLKISKQRVSVGDEVFVIGYPSGLPVKISREAIVKKVLNNFFKANLDTFAGNSGSAVFSENSDEVVGILVKGQTDYEYNRARDCFSVNVCADALGGFSCSGEGVTHLDVVDLKRLP